MRESKHGGRVPLTEAALGHRIVAFIKAGGKAVPPDAMGETQHTLEVQTTAGERSYGRSEDSER